MKTTKKVTRNLPPHVTALSERVAQQIVDQHDKWISEREILRLDIERARNTAQSCRHWDLVKLLDEQLEEMELAIRWLHEQGHIVQLHLKDLQATI